MLDLVAFILLTGMTYRIVVSARREAAIFAEFKQSMAVAYSALLFPLGPVAMLLVGTRASMIGHSPVCRLLRAGPCSGEKTECKLRSRGHRSREGGKRRGVRSFCNRRGRLVVHRSSAAVRRDAGYARHGNKWLTVPELRRPSD